MNPRVAAIVVSLAGLPAAAAAQTVIYSWAWHEVNAGTSTPVATSNGNLEPGEGARLVLTATVTPGIGSPVTYSPPPPPGSGTIAGLGSVFFDLIGTGVMGGTWAANNRTPGGVSWALAPFGQPQPNGDFIAGGAGQFVQPGQVANSTNPVVGIWSMTWTPSVYTIRVASFQSQGAVAGEGNHSSILIKYGEDPNTGAPFYVGRFVDSQFGGSGPIPIVPGPAGLMVLGLGAMVAAGRRRN